MSADSYEINRQESGIQIYPADGAKQCSSPNASTSSKDIHRRCPTDPYLLALSSESVQIACEKSSMNPVRKTFVRVVAGQRWSQVLLVQCASWRSLSVLDDSEIPERDIAAWDRLRDEFAVEVIGCWIHMVKPFD